jgi:Tfp pilus tip-associated adhesin PilY1
MLFGTNQPDPSNLTCTGNLGIARRYAVNVLTGAASTYTNSSGQLVLWELYEGGGFPPGPTVAGSRVGSDGITRVYTTDNPLNPGGITSFVVNPPTKRSRIWWREILE